MELVIWIATFVLIYWATKGKSKSTKRYKGRKAWEEGKTDIDPVTGDYTSKYDGQRYTKEGILIWWK